jgi:hypothetical protein
MVSEKTDPLDPKTRVLHDLIIGRREPANEYERKLLEEIKVIQAEGYEVEIPNEFI